VQYVIRPDLHFRGYAGQLASGSIRPGDPVLLLPSGHLSRVKSLPAFDGDLTEAFAPMSATVCLEDELDVSRGDMLVNPQHPPVVSRNFQAHVVWMSATPLRLNHQYLIKHTTQQVTATITTLRHKIDVNNLAEVCAIDLQLNEIGTVQMETNRPLFFDPYRANRLTGSFILIDPISNATLAAGMIDDDLNERTDRSRKRQTVLSGRTERVTPAERYASAGHYPATIWISGTEELAYLVERKLFSRGCHAQVLSTSINPAFLPQLMRVLNEAGLISIVSVTEGYAAQKDLTRAAVGQQRFFEFNWSSLALSNSDSAAQEICTTLEKSGVIRPESVASGEGI
jgi:hypothetical protein